uniref:Cytochrome P450, family 2, subfamily Y, polypeptide 3 n=1 Tax=Myripristis murdjan TaxID=586833 RepID=A0A667YH77_9TELE
SIMELNSTLILAGLSLVLLWLFHITKKIKYRLPPGPTGLPLIGNLAQLDRRAPYKTLESYGPVLTVYLGPQRTVVLVGYDAIKEALVDQGDDFTGRGPFPFLVKVTRGYGKTRILHNGERWRQLRRFTMTTLRDFGMGRKGMEEWIQGESRHLVGHMESTDGICALCVVYFIDCNCFRTLRIHLVSCHQTKLRVPVILYSMYNVFPWVMDRLPGQHQAMFGKIDRIREFIMMKIQEHKETMDPSSPRDYIDCFLTRLNQEEDNLTTEFHYDNLVSTVLNLFLAGTETTSTTLRYALSVLIKYLNIQEKMQQEICTVIGKERCPSMEDRKSLPFTDAVIHEVQRFLDVVPFSFPHYALKDISFRGYTIPKDTIIIPLLHSLMREEKQWATPWSFNPQHFLDQNGNFKKNPAFFPFSAGKRSCAGESLARMELFLFLVSLLQRFTFSCPGGPDSVDLSPEHSGFANVPRTYKIIATPC